mgnify:CR=1 FL=1
MSDYYWCHGPKCHTYETQDRVRGSKGSKVLRTKKIKQNNYGYPSGVWQYFCSNGCYNDFAREHAEQIIKIAPRTTPLETPCEVKTETREGWNGRYTYKTVDKLSNVG